MRTRVKTPRPDTLETLDPGLGAPPGVMDGTYAEDRQRKAHLDFRYRSRAFTAARAFRRFAPRTKRPRVLDFGSADGRALVEVHRLLDAQESIGIEFSQDLIARADTMPEGARLVQGDVTRTHDCIEERSFDLVTALALLEHLDRPEDLLAQARRALKPGGIFAATCPSPFWDKISGTLKLHQEEFHQVDFNRKTFERLARQSHLEPLLYQRFMFVAIGFLPYLKIEVSVRLADRLDRLLRLPRILNPLFVNQLFVARAPAPGEAARGRRP